MRKKGETSERDRSKPQPMQKKVREEKRKKKKLDRATRQEERKSYFLRGCKAPSPKKGIRKNCQDSFGFAVNSPAHVWKRTGNRITGL